MRQQFILKLGCNPLQAMCHGDLSKTGISVALIRPPKSENEE